MDIEITVFSQNNHLYNYGNVFDKDHAASLKFKYKVHTYTSLISTTIGLYTVSVSLPA